MVTKCFIVNLFFKMQTIPYRYILIRYCTLSYKKQFCDKESFRCPKNELFVKTWSLLGEISYGGMVTKCFIVNLFFKMQTIPYRYILIRYCTLSYKKRFCDKESFRCPKNELFVKTSSLLGEISYGGMVTKCFIVNLFFKMQTIPYRYILIRYCTLSYKKRFCDKESFRCPKNELFVKTSSLLGEISYGGMVTKCFIVNLFFKIQTI